jgi:hypothetical protein
MRESGEPTWRLVLLAAQRLDAVTGEFRMQDLVDHTRTDLNHSPRFKKRYGASSLSPS